LENRVSLLILGCMVCTTLLESDDVEAWNAGKSFGASVKTHYGTHIKSTLVEPMTNEAKPFSTMDGSKTFSANMTCGETTKSFMSVTYTLGSVQSGIVTVVKIDKDLDGTKEYTFVSPYTASALCSNGIAVCLGGNFTNANQCAYYQYQYDGNTLSLVASASNTMSACRCINDTCGSLASTEKEALVGSIASNVYSVVAPYSASYALSDVKIVNGVAEYFGQRVDGCANFQGTVAQTGTSTSIDPSSNILLQSTNPKSSYTALLGTSQNYATHSPSVTTHVTSTKNASKATLGSVSHQEGTTDFTTKNYATGATLQGHVGIPLTSDEELYCQVKWLSASNEVFTDNTERSTATNSGQQWQSETRLCVNNICPLSPSKGESIKHDCGAIDNFQEAASAFSALQELADDITCGSL